MNIFASISRAITKALNPIHNPVVQGLLEVTHLKNSPIFGILNGLVGGAGSSDLLGSIFGSLAPGALSILMPEVGLVIQAAKILGPAFSGYPEPGQDVAADREIGDNLRKSRDFSRLRGLYARKPDLRSQAHAILDDPSLSPEEKILLLTGLLADALDKKLNKLMKQWADEASRAAKTDDKDKKTDHQNRYNILQTRIQRVNAQKSRILSWGTIMLKNLHEMAKKPIENTRV